MGKEYTKRNCWRIICYLKTIRTYRSIKEIVNKEHRIKRWLRINEDEIMYWAMMLSILSSGIMLAILIFTK